MEEAQTKIFTSILLLMLYAQQFNASVVAVCCQLIHVSQHELAHAANGI